MKWKEHLHIIKERGILDQAQLELFLKLPDIRDEVFFPDYESLGYAPETTIVDEWEFMVSISLCLISVSANRKLNIQYSFIKSFGKSDKGVFNDLIHVLSENTGWENTVYMDVLAYKRFGIQLGEYNKLPLYPGDFGEQCKACMLQIKNNYDVYARDIISGDQWDYHAWRDDR